jgi:hypothetical protein
MQFALLMTVLECSFLKHSQRILGINLNTPMFNLWFVHAFIPIWRFLLHILYTPNSQVHDEELSMRDKFENPVVSTTFIVLCCFMV